jgi:hypothetical protein
MDFSMEPSITQPISARKRMELMTSPQQTESQLTQRTQYEEEVTVDLDLTDEETPNPSQPPKPSQTQPKPESKEAHINNLKNSTKTSTETLLAYVLFKIRAL